MFRYICLAWDDTHLASSAVARRLSLPLQAQADWQPALLRKGLHVFTTGTKPGINGALPLAGQRGVVLGKLFRRRDLHEPAGRDISLSADEADRILRTGGHALVDGYWGRYVAVLPAGPGGAAILRDPSGALPCFVTRHEGVWIVFSWLEDVLTKLPEVPRPGVDWNGLMAHIQLGELSGRDTALEGVRRVLPGEILRLGADPHNAELFWNGVDFARSPADDGVETATEKLRDTVRACAQAWASCHDDILLRLSGGVDSSILASCLAIGRTASRVTCLNYHSPGADSDERSYARLAAARAGRELIERQRDTDFRLEHILNIARTPTPVNHVGRMAARIDAGLAAALGASAMFTGGGGDSVFFEYPCWWPAADYLRQRGLDSGFIAAALDAARLARVSVWRALGLAVMDRFRKGTPEPETDAYPSLLDRSAFPLVKPDERFVHRALLQADDLPIGKLTQTRHLMHPIGYYDPFEREAAPESVHPLLSQPLVELCLRLPTFVLTHGGRGRALARRAFEADLPPEVTARRSKGGMEEHIKAVLFRSLDFARGMLMDGELARRGILDPTRVEQALSSHPTTLISHAGEIHRFIGIEAWLTRWPVPAAGSAA